MSSSDNHKYNNDSANPASQAEKIDITTILDDMFKEFLRLWW